MSTPTSSFGGFGGLQLGNEKVRCLLGRPASTACEAGAGLLPSLTCKCTGLDSTESDRLIASSLQFFATHPTLAAALRAMGASAGVQLPVHSHQLQRGLPAAVHRKLEGQQAAEAAERQGTYLEQSEPGSCSLQARPQWGHSEASSQASLVARLIQARV